MNKQRLGRAAPTIAVTNVQKASAFYCAALGFNVTFQNGQPVVYCVLKKDDAEIHLAHSDEPSPGSTNVMHLLVSDAEAALATCQSAGATIVEPLRDAPWGMRTFVFQDLDGHRVDVGQPLKKE